MYQPGSLSVGQGLSCVWIHDSLYEGVEWEVLDSPLPLVTTTCFPEVCQTDLGRN